MYLLLSLVSLAGALYVTYMMTREEVEEAAEAETVDVAMWPVEVPEAAMQPPREEGLGALVAAMTGSLRTFLRGWLGRQDANLQ